MEREHEAESTSALLAALYSEDAEEVSPELGEELAAYQSLRSLFADLPDEEPPTDLNAKLIRAAANAASPTAESGPSLWDRVLAWFEPLRANPGLTALASLVLVASIGGVLYVGGKAKTNPRLPGAASDDAPALVGDQAKADEKAGDKAANLEVGEATEDPASEAAAPAPRETVGVATSKKSSVAKGPATKKNKKRTRRPANNAALEADVGQTIILDAPDGEELKKETPRTGTVGGTRAPEPAPPPPPATVSPAQSKKLSSLRKKARGYAKSGDCTSVRKLGKQVRDIDDAYYDRSFLGDEQIASCYRVKK